ncbi:MAG TPA: hypothetical protein DF294_00660 [Psychrobacter sp.]|nr:hypothetical protein [Psychrobacter sp.]
MNNSYASFNEQKYLDNKKAIEDANRLYIVMPSESARYIFRQSSPLSNTIKKTSREVFFIADF